MLRTHKIKCLFQTDKNCEKSDIKPVFKQHRNFKLQNCCFIQTMNYYVPIKPWPLYFKPGRNMLPVISRAWENLKINISGGIYKHNQHNNPKCHTTSLFTYSSLLWDEFLFLHLQIMESKSGSWHLTYFWSHRWTELQ